MKNLYQQNKSRRRLLVATVFVIAVFVADTLSGGSARAFARAGAAYMWATGASAGETVFDSGFFSTRRALEKENKSLREELTQLQTRVAVFDILKSENESLRLLTRFTERERGITAPIISSFRSSPYGTFLIGAGSEDGIRAGNLVMAGDPQFGGFVIGRVENTDARISLVKAVFAPNETTDAVISGISVMLLGRGGGQARAEAPRDAEIKTGDAVFSPLMGGKAIGVVGGVEVDKGDASERVYVMVPFSLTSRFVYIIGE
ncbi:TPA: hypothetical protein DIS55_01465 [Candidatus Kaiserbacteria bacterium]|nr:hypothetical protein [Candidatus Kaiserbacteria bacterium]